jgi:cytoskeleton protein RodZ
MSQIPENNTDQSDHPAAMPAVSLGKMLREARERHGFSVADVAAQIKFAPRQIEALEADDLMHLPEEAFLRGFVRSYAKILQLDAQALLEALPQSKSPVPEQMATPVNEPFPVAHSSQRQNQILLGSALLIAVIVAGFAIWHFTNPIQKSSVAKVETPVSLPAELPTGPAPQVMKQDTMAPSIPAETKPRSTAQAAKPAAAQSGPKVQSTDPLKHSDSTTNGAKSASVQSAPKIQSTDPLKHSDSTMNIVKPATVQSVPKIQSTDSSMPPNSTVNKIKMRLVFEVESWAEIKDKDGKILSARVHEPGTEMRLGGLPPVALVIGRAGSVHLFKNDEPVDLKPYTNSYSEVARLTLE